MDRMVPLLVIISIVLLIYVEATTINATQSNSRKIDIICDPNEDCTINCLGEYSCEYYTIYCIGNSAAFQCNLLCANFGACKSTTLIAKSVATLNILCQTDTKDSNGFGEVCDHLNVTATGYSTYSSTVHITTNVLDSTESKLSKFATFSLHNFHQLSLDCNTKRSCSSIHLLSDNNYYVDLNCGADHACAQSTMIFNSTTSMALVLSSNALYRSTMIINGLNQNMAIDCSNDACYHSEWHLKHITRYGTKVMVDCGNGTNTYDPHNLCSYSVWDIDEAIYKFEMKCRGYYSCNDLSIKGDCSKATIDCLDGCLSNTIHADDCSNSGAIFPPTKQPTVSPNAPGGSSAWSDVHCTSSSNTIAYIIFILLSLVVCGLSVVCFAYYLYKTNQTSDASAAEPTRLKPHPLPRIKEEPEAMTIEGDHEFEAGGGAVISSTHTKQKEKTKDLHKEQLLVTVDDDDDADDSDHEAGYTTDIIAIRAESSWCDTLILHKRYYFEIIPHLLDNVLFICVAVQLYTIYKESNECRINNRMFALYICSCLVLVIYRIVSAAQIMYWTTSVRQTILQLFDLEIFEALMVHYQYSDRDQKMNKYAACSPQVWLSLNEVSFQTAPMTIILSIYIFSTGYLYTHVGLLHITLIWCIIHICIRNIMEDDRRWENLTSQKLKARLRADDASYNGKEWPPMPRASLINERVMDVICRMGSVSLLIAIHPLIGSILIMIECVVLFGYALYTHKYRTVLYHLLVRRELFDHVLMIERCIANCIMIATVFVIIFTSSPSASLYAIYTLFAFIGVYSLGSIKLIKTNIHPPIRWYHEHNQSYFGDHDTIFDSDRSVTSLMQQHLWKEIFDFVLFGVEVTPKDLVQKNEKLFENVSEDFEEKGGKPFLYFLMKGTDLESTHINSIWMGTLQAYENKEEREEEAYMDLIELLYNIMKSAVLDINCRTQLNSRTVLHMLCVKRHSQYLCAKVLQFETLNPNILDKKDESALHILCDGMDAIETQMEMVKHILLLPNINVNITGQSNRNDNETPLHFCIKNNNKATVALFLSHPLIDLTVLTEPHLDNYLHFAAKHNATDEDIILSIFKNDKFEFNVNDIESNGNTVLHLSAAKPHFVDSLLECKEIEVNIANHNGFVPLIKFVTYPKDNASLQRLLTVKSLNINAIDNNGSCALHHAIRVPKRNKSTQHISLLLSHPDIDVNIQNKARGHVGGCSALHECLMSNAVPLEYIQLLLQHPTTNVNLQTLEYGETVLHIAIRLDLWNRNDDTRYMKLESILNHKEIDKNIQNNAGKIPINIARGQWRVAEGALVTAQSQLMRAQQELTSRQIVYQNTSNVYQTKFALYQSAKTKYDIFYAQYESALQQYNSAPSEMQSRMTRPSPPSTTMYSAQESEMNMAKSRMDGAASDVSSAEMNVNHALDQIELFQYKIYCAKLIIDALK